MDIFMKVLGILISLAFIFIGVRFIFSPRKSIQALQRMKYHTTGEPGKREKIFSLIFGILFLLIGLYYLAMVIVSLIYPA